MVLSILGMILFTNYLYVICIIIYNYFPLCRINYSIYKNHCLNSLLHMITFVLRRPTSSQEDMQENRNVYRNIV